MSEIVSGSMSANSESMGIGPEHPAGCPCCGNSSNEKPEAAPLDSSAPLSSNPGFDIVGASAGNAGALAIGGSVSGYINSNGDHDWYAVNLVAGQSYTFTLTSSGGAYDPYLRLRDGSGTTLAENDDSGGLNSRIVFTATTSGTYYLDAGAFGDTTAGGYQLGAAAYTPPPVYTYDQIASFLTTGYWGGAVSHWTPGSTITYNVQGLLPAAATLAREAFTLWQDAINLRFVETTGPAQITLDDTQAGAFADFNSINNVTTSATVNIAQNWSGEATPGHDSYTLQTFIHEIGHTLGLGHGGSYNGNAVYGVDNHYQNDTWAATVMSYFDPSNYNGASDRYVMTPMIADLVALQGIYGANTTTRATNTVYGHNSTAGSTYDFSTYTTTPSFTIWDGGGIDTIDASGYSDAQTINLRPEQSSSIGGLQQNIHVARGAVIENAIGGSGNDMIQGNTADNTVHGMGGNDTIDVSTGNDTVYGGDGNDTLIGRAGNDTLYGDAGDDVIDGGLDNDTMIGGNGNDRMYGYLGNDRIEGQDGNDFGWGDGGNDTLIGATGRDDMRGAAGNDVIYGGLGDDYYFGGSESDRFYLMDGGIITNEFDAILDFEDTDTGGVVNDYIYLPSAARYASLIFDQGEYTWIATWDPAAPDGLHYNAIVGTTAAAVMDNIVYV